MSFLSLRAVGIVPAEELGQLADELRHEFQGEVQTLEPLNNPSFAWDPSRRQYNSALILRELVRTCPPDAHRLLGITEFDLFIPMLSFVFGQAQLSGRVALISFARLRQEFYGIAPAASVFEERARKEALHELGHTFSLTHCPDRGCPMSLSTGIAQVDDKGSRYCGSCAAQLRELDVPLIGTERTV